MISILTQRILGAALGSAFSAVVVLENRSRMHRSISDCRNSEPKEHGVRGINISADFAHICGTKPSMEHWGDWLRALARVDGNEY